MCKYLLIYETDSDVWCHFDRSAYTKKGSDTLFYSRKVQLWLGLGKYQIAPDTRKLLNFKVEMSILVSLFWLPVLEKDIKTRQILTILVSLIKPGISKTLLKFQLNRLIGTRVIRFQSINQKCLFQRNAFKASDISAAAYKFREMIW